MMILDSDYDAAIRREQLAQQRAEAAERERDEARAELERVKQERDALLSRTNHRSLDVETNYNEVLP